MRVSEMPAPPGWRAAPLWFEGVSPGYLEVDAWPEPSGPEAQAPRSQCSPSVRGGPRAEVEVSRIPRRARAARDLSTWTWKPPAQGSYSRDAPGQMPTCPPAPDLFPGGFPHSSYPSSWEAPSLARGAAGWWAHQATSSPQGLGGAEGAGCAVEGPAGGEPRLCASREPASPGVGWGATAPFPGAAGPCCEGLNSQELTYLRGSPHRAAQNGGVACQRGPDGNKGAG